eukprot:1139625-Pelagomonas_calceolata.AAC.5
MGQAFSLIAPATGICCLARWVAAPVGGSAAVPLAACWAGMRGLLPSNPAQFHAQRKHMTHVALNADLQQRHNGNKSYTCKESPLPSQTGTLLPELANIRHTYFLKQEDAF